jgi:hypothetical protein
MFAVLGAPDPQPIWPPLYDFCRGEREPGGHLIILGALLVGCNPPNPGPRPAGREIQKYSQYWTSPV